MTSAEIGSRHRARCSHRLSAERGRPRFFLRLHVVAAALIACALPHAAQAHTTHYAFAVMGSAMEANPDEALAQRVIEAVGQDDSVRFIVYDGNLKSATEGCRDALYERRQAVLGSSKVPLVFVPGQHDWVDCGSSAAGGFDPVERLDQLRQTFFSDPASMGQTTLPLTRESEVSRFHPYRENVRWVVGDTVFVGLNVPGGNNHYLTAGGRNGEFEDRVIANAFWLDHAAEYAKRRGARAIVVFVEGDPDPERYERPDRFAWLRFGGRRKRDGYLEFKRDLVKLADSFRGPVLLVHWDQERTPGGYSIDQPLRNEKGALVTNLTRIALRPKDRLNQWVKIDADLTRKPPFRVSVHTVPKDMPLLPPPTVQTHDAPLPEMPEVPSSGGASDDTASPTDLPPILPAPALGATTPRAASGTSRPPASSYIQGMPDLIGPGATGTLPPAVPASSPSSMQRGF